MCCHEFAALLGLHGKEQVFADDANLSGGEVIESGFVFAHFILSSGCLESAFFDFALDGEQGESEASAPAGFAVFGSARLHSFQLSFVGLEQVLDVSIPIQELIVGFVVHWSSFKWVSWLDSFWLFRFCSLAGD